MLSELEITGSSARMCESEGCGERRAASVWACKKGEETEKTAVCVDCQMEEFEADMSSPEFVLKDNGHRKAVEKWCSGVAGEHDDDSYVDGVDDDDVDDVAMEDAESSIPKWECSSCETENDESVKKCGSCMQPRK